MNVIQFSIVISTTLELLNFEMYKLDSDGDETLSFSETRLVDRKTGLCLLDLIVVWRNVIWVRALLFERTRSLQW